jgi:flagellar motor protein MotB
MRKIFSKNKGEDHNLWMSYTDLMFGFLIIFITTNIIAHHRYGVTKMELEKFEEIQESVKNIDSTYFIYDSKYKRYTLKDIKISFNNKSAKIDDISLENRQKLLRIGLSILKFVNTAVDKNPNVKYLLIIEGQSSKDYYDTDEYRNNDVLSYQRALSLKRFWSDSNIKFDAKKCELIIAGSGQESPFRENPDNRWNKKNQRFVIHIIPKIGDFK